MKFKEGAPYIKLGLKRETASDLYRILSSQENLLSRDLLKVLHMLENYIMTDATISEMEDLLD